MKVGLVYHKDDEAILEALSKELTKQFEGRTETLELHSKVIDDYSASRLVNQFQDMDLLVNCLSFSFLAAENTFANEWIDFVRKGNKSIAVLLRPCIWELTYFSDFSTLPESGKPLIDLDYSSTSFKRKVEEIHDRLIGKKHSDADYRSGLSKEELKAIKDLVIEDKLDEAIHLLKDSAESMNQMDKDSVHNLLGRLNRLKREAIDGIISFEDKDLTRNKLRRAFLDLLAKLSDSEA